MRNLLICLMLAVATPASAADVIRRKPDASAPYRLEFVFARIDSVNADGFLFGQKIGLPLTDSTGAYLGRDTTAVALKINWGVADTLLAVSLELDSTQVQGTTLLVAGELLQLDYSLDSSALADDSLWLLAR